MFKGKLEIQNSRANVDRNAGDILQVIGARLPRIGTSSLAVAMAILGFAPAFRAVS